MSKESLHNLSDRIRHELPQFVTPDAQGRYYFGEAFFALSLLLLRNEIAETDVTRFQDVLAQALLEQPFVDAYQVALQSLGRTTPVSPILGTFLGAALERARAYFNDDSPKEWSTVIASLLDVVQAGGD